MAKVKVWKRLDGGVSITPFDFRKKHESESEDQFIDRVSAKLRVMTHLVGADEFMMDESDIPFDRKDRGKWRVNPSGNKVIIDHSITLPEEAKAVKRASAKSKLKALGLTEEEIDAL